MAIRRLPFLIVALLFVDFIDEFASGMPTIGAPGIQSEFGIRYSTAALIVFTGPLFVSWLLEPPIFLLADRHRKKLFIVGGLFAMGALDVVIGLSGSLYVVAGALLLSAPASGAGVSLSQATLMDLHPGDRERLMARWVFMGAAGDMAAPALFWLLGALALGWREAFLASGVLILLYATMLSRRSFAEPAPSPAPSPPPNPATDPAPEPDALAAGDAPSAGASDPGMLAALRTAFGDRKLLVWLFAAWLCNLMDEILVAFGALHLRDNLGADSQTRALILMAYMAGMLLGLAILERLLARFEPLRLLAVAAVGSGAAYTAWLFARDPITSALWMAVTGLFAGSLYPLAKAQAYRALPGRSGMLNAMAHVFTPLDVLLPLALGLLADHFGLLLALSLLLVQPLGLLVIAILRRRDGDSRRDEGATPA